jgi:hypothetical protein
VSQQSTTILAPLALLVMAVGCGAAGPSNGGSGSSRAGGAAAAVSACESSWQAFAAIDDMHDSVEDAVPTLFACHDRREWIGAGKATPGHSFVVAKVTAANLCRYQKNVEEAAVCHSL